MHYDTESNRHGLRHDPFKALVAPRPIGWIATVGPDGTTNLAPYSFFNSISDRPPMVMFASSGRKDSLKNLDSAAAGAPMDGPAATGGLALDPTTTSRFGTAAAANLQDGLLVWTSLPTDTTQSMQVPAIQGR